MNELMKRCLELEALQAEIHSRIHKVKVILGAQQEGSFNTSALLKYRNRYISQLLQHRRIIRRQQMELIDKLEIKEISSMMLVIDQPGIQ